MRDERHNVTDVLVVCRLVKGSSVTADCSCCHIMLIQCPHERQAINRLDLTFAFLFEHLPDFSILQPRLAARAKNFLELTEGNISLIATCYPSTNRNFLPLFLFLLVA